jgi:DNA-binding transcriptional LysR family regulator
MMDKLGKMRMYMAVADTGSFTAAAQLLGSTTAQASRAVSDLETHLRSRLLNRSTRRVALTEAGARYLEQCREILDRVDIAEAQAGDAKALPKGVLRLHAPSAFGQYYVIPALAKYCEKYPDVRVDLTLSQHAPDILEGGFDVSLHVTHSPLPDSAMVAAQLCSVPTVLCAAPSYLAKIGSPKTLADLRKHGCLQLLTSFFASDKWTFSSEQGTEVFDVPLAKLRVSSAEALAIALREGMGIAPLPLLTALSFLKSGELVRVMPTHELQSSTVYALYASREYLDAKIATWITFLRDYIAASLLAGQSATKVAPLKGMGDSCSG